MVLLPAMSHAVDQPSADKSAPTPGYHRRPLTARKTDTPPVIDGDLNDKCWVGAPSAEVFLDDQTGTVVPDQTTAYLLYDSKYIYVAFRCKESHPEKIVAHEIVQNSNYQGGNNNQGPTEDYVEVQFDPFCTHKYQDRSLFSVNAIGTKSASLAGGRANKIEWQGDWDAGVRRQADGWTAEMRIPWKALNYPTTRQNVMMGINFSRFQTWSHTVSYWSSLGPQHFYENDGQWQGVEVPQATFHPHTSFLPYTITGTKGTNGEFTAGLDTRTAITPQLTAIGTLNPDFSTIENALTSIQFSRAAQIIPEARPFFLEGSNAFQVANINLIGAYFLSQQIPAFDFGTKLYGKLTQNDSIGFLNTTSFGNRDDLAINFRHDQSATSFLDIYASQLSATNDNNSIIVASEQWRKNKLSFNAQWALTSGNQSGGDANQFALLYQDKTVFTAFGYENVSPSFRDADGYVPFNDIHGFVWVENANSEWRHGFFRNYALSFVPQYTWHSDGRPYQRGVSTELYMETRSDWSIDIAPNYDYFDDSRDATLSLSITKGASNRFRQIGIQVLAGTEADTPALFIAPKFSFRLFRHLDLGYNGAVQSLDGVTQQHVTTFNYELSPTRSVGGRFTVQNGAINWYGFYRNSGGRGTNFYLILGDPNAERFVPRIQFKTVWAL